MEVSQSLQFLRVAAWAAPVLAIAWALIAGKLDEQPDLKRQPAAPVAVFSLIAVCGVAIVAFVLNSLLTSIEKGQIIWLNTLLGGAAALLAIAIIGHLRSREMDSMENSRWPQANSAVVAIAVATLLGAYLITRHSARPDAWVCAAGMGAALVAGIFALAAESNKPTSPGASLPIRMALAVELAAAASCAVAIAIVCGRLLTFSGGTLKHAGDSFTIYLAIALIIWVPLSVLQRVFLRSSRLAATVLAFVFTALVAWLGHLSSAVNFLPLSASQCLWTGLAAGLALGGMHSGALFHKVSGFDRQAAVIAMVVVMAAAAVCLRLLGGFGILLCAAGILASAPAWSLLTPWRFRDDNVQLPFPAPLTWAAAFLTGAAALRVWLAWNDTIRISIDSPYVVLGLTIGLGLPFAMWSLVAGSREDTLATGTTAMAAFGSIIGVTLVIGAIIGVSMVLREPAVRVFLLGLAAANLAGAVALSGAREDWTSAPVVSLSLLASLITLTASPALASFTAELGRPEKVKGLLILFAISLALYLALEIWRLLASRKKTTAIIEHVEA